MPKAKKREVSKVKTSEIFTDRNEVQKAFRRQYEELSETIREAQTEDDLEYRILNIYGISGIGKTSVLERFRDITENEYKSEKDKEDCLFYSFEVRRDREKESFLFYLAYMILKNDPRTDLSKFLYAYRKSLLETDSTRIVIDDLETMDRKKIGIGNEAVKTGVAAAIDLGSMVVRSIPMANTVLELAGWLIDGVSDKYFERSLEKNVRSEIDGHSDNELKKKLHEWLAEEAYAYFSSLKTPFVIFLDGFEKYEVRDPELSGTEGHWLKYLIESLPNILWVIAGREKLNWGERYGLTEETQICLDDFSESIVREYFDRYWEKYGTSDLEKIPDNLIIPIWKLTRGVPIYLRLCLDNYERYEDKANITIEAFGKDTTELLVRFFDNYSDDQKSAMLFLCCIPDGWTQNNVFEIYDIMKNKTGDRTGIRLDLGILNSLLKTVAFEEYGLGYRIHSIIRESVLKNAVDLIKERLEAITEAMKEYADLCGELGMPGRKILYYEEVCRCWQVWGETHNEWIDRFVEYKDELAHLYLSRLSSQYDDDDLFRAIGSLSDAVKLLEEKYGASDWKTLEEKSQLAYYMSIGNGQEQRAADLFRECFVCVKNAHSEEPLESIRYLYYMRDASDNWPDHVVEHIKELAQIESICNDPEVQRIMEAIDERMHKDEEIDRYLNSKEYLDSCDTARSVYECELEEMHENYTYLCDLIAQTEEFTKTQVDELLEIDKQFFIRGYAYYGEGPLSELYKKLITQFGNDNEITVNVLDSLADHLEEWPSRNDLKKAIEYRTRIYKTYKADSSKDYDQPIQYVLLWLAEDEQKVENVEKALMYYKELRDIYKPGIVEITLDELNDRIRKLERIK